MASLRSPLSVSSSATNLLSLSLRLRAKPSPSPHLSLRAFSSSAQMALDLLSPSPLPSLVGGKAFVGSASYDVKDAHYPDKIVHTVSALSSTAEVEEVLQVAARAAKTWRNTSVFERRAIFLKAAALLKERVGEYAGNEVEETTSSPTWAGFEMGLLAVGNLEETAAAATSALRGEIAITGPEQKAYIERCPFGVVYSMAAWNAPTVLSMRAVAQPLMAGNAVILKTSEMSPRTQLALGQIFSDAGLPDGVLSVIHVKPEDAPRVSEQIIAHRAVGKINFTGSTRVGSILAQVCGKHIKPIVLELGGKAPAIVLPDADLELASQAIMFGGWFHQGQVCMATQSLIVHESVKDKLLELIQNHVKTVTASADLADNTKLRGLFTQASADKIKECVDDALGKGAKVAAGEIGFSGNVVQPILLEGVTRAMRIYREEMFGPVFSLLTFNTIEEAIEIANDHDYGLAAAVFTKDTDAGYKIAREIDAGAVHINGPTIHDAGQIPHGGWKKSGYGRFNGFEGIREFTQTKVITINEAHPFPI